jgi:hypothetical protein
MRRKRTERVFMDVCGENIAPLTGQFAPRRQANIEGGKFMRKREKTPVIASPHDLTPSPLLEGEGEVEK